MADISIAYPTTEKDYADIVSLVESNLYKEKSLLDEIKEASVGEVMIAKKDGLIVGMLSMRRPGKIFKEIEDKYFDLNALECSKDDTGYIALVAVKKKMHGQGVGKLLVKKAIELQNEWDAKAIVVHASQSSPGHAADRLFSSFGFVPTKLHTAPWHDYSKEAGPDGFWCNFCGNPCKCDELEMVYYIKRDS